MSACGHTHSPVHRQPRAGLGPHKAKWGEVGATTGLQQPHVGLRGRIHAIDLGPIKEGDARSRCETKEIFSDGTCSVAIARGIGSCTGSGNRQFMSAARLIDPTRRRHNLAPSRFFGYFYIWSWNTEIRSLNGDAEHIWLPHYGESWWRIQGRCRKALFPTTSGTTPRSCQVVC